MKLSPMNSHGATRLVLMPVRLSSQTRVGIDVASAIPSDQ
jgi:hypothetical protein